MYGNKVRNKDYTLLLSSPPPNFYPFPSHSLPPTPTPLPLSSSSFFFYSMLTFQPVSNLLATSTTEFPPPFPPHPSYSPTPPHSLLTSTPFFSSLFRSNIISAINNTNYFCINNVYISTGYLNQIC